MPEKTTANQQPKKSKTRVITGVIASLIAIAAIVLGSIPLYLLLIVIMYIASGEFVRILKHKGFHPSLTIIRLSAIVFSTLTFFHSFDLASSILTLTIMASFLIVLFKGRQPYIVNVATTALGALYCGWLPSHMLLMRQIGSERISAFQISLSDGLGLLMFVFIAVALTDIGAYYFGINFGKTKLAEVISPKKTVEGAIGGAICAIIASCFGVFYTSLNLPQAIIGGLLVTLSAQLGDLSESLIKRDAGVKDSSDILPGHGGMLDRFDGYIFALPVAYYFFMHFTRGTNILESGFQFFLNFIHKYWGVINVHF